MTTFLTFQAMQDAQDAADKIWYNYLTNHANNTERLVGDGGGNDYFLSDIQGMTEAQVLTLKAYGKKQNIIQNTTGLIERYTELHHADNDPNLWVFPKPSNAALMVGVSNYTEQVKNPLWWAEPY